MDPLHTPSLSQSPNIEAAAPWAGLEATIPYKDVEASCSWSENEQGKRTFEECNDNLIPLKRQKLEQQNIEQLSPRSKKSYEYYKILTMTHSPESKRTFAEVKEAQSCIMKDGHYAFEILESNDHPALLVQEKAFQIIGNPAGAGTQSEAIFSNEIPFNGRAPTRRLIKFSSHSFDTQKEKLDRMEGADGTLDLILQSGKVFPFTKNYGIFNPSTGDITTIDFQKIDKPAKFIIGQLIDWAQGIKAIHDQGCVHCDIKGANLLYNLYGRGKVTDTGSMQDVPEEGEIHLVRGTPTYIAPFVWSDVTKQRIIEKWGIKSLGHQSKPSDVYSFGIMIQKNILERIAGAFGKDLASETQPEKMYEPISDEEMVEIEQNHPGRVIYVIANRFSNNPGFLLKYPIREEVYEKTMNAINLLQNNLPENEIEILKQLAILAYELQNSDPNQIPCIDEVLNRLRGC